jgi:ribosomal protein S8
MRSSVIPIFLAKMNAARRGHFISIKVDHCNIILQLLNMLHGIGIIRGYQIMLGENKIKVFFKYVSGGSNIFSEMAVVSRPGRKKFVNLLRLYKLKEREGGSVIYIISTSRGILFDSECLSRQIGGEVLIKIVL